MRSKRTAGKETTTFRSYNDMRLSYNLSSKRPQNPRANNNRVDVIYFASRLVRYYTLLILRSDYQTIDLRSTAVVYSQVSASFVLFCTNSVLCRFTWALFEKPACSKVHRYGENRGVNRGPEDRSKFPFITDFCFAEV